MAHVLLEGISKHFGPVTVIEQLDLRIEDRDFLVLVGPSGRGKSTVLRLIAGLEELTAGTIRIGRRVGNDVAPKDRDIAMVFQSYALYPHMSVRQNLEFGLRIRRVPAAEIARLGARRLPHAQSAFRRAGLDAQTGQPSSPCVDNPNH